MKDRYRILHLEDVSTDAELVKRELTENQIFFDYLVIDTELQYVKALDEFKPDLILCDHSLPSFNSFEALAILKAKKLNIPFIVITATMTEDVAMNLVRERADDYILKDRLQRLPYVVLNAIDKYRFEKKRIQLVDEAYKKEAASKEIAIHLAGKLLLATQIAGIGIWEFLFREKKFIADDVLLSLYGITQAQAIGTYEAWMQYIHPADKERINREFHNALATCIDFDTEFRNVWPDGSIHFIKGVAKVQRDSNGKPISFIGTNQDITESKKANEEMQRLTNRFQLATDSAGIGVWEWDLESGNLSWDTNMHQLYNIDELQLGSVYEGWLVRLHLDDKMRVNEEIQMAIAGKKEYNTEFRIVWSNSSVRYIKATGMVERDSTGKPVRMIGTNQDITPDKKAEQLTKESEARYRSFFESSIDGILLTGIDGEIYAANPAACHIFQTTEEELCKTGRTGIADPTDLRFQSLLEERRRIGKAKGEVTFIRKNGSLFPGEVSSAIYTDAYGQKRASTIIRDITEQKLSQHEINSTAEALEEALNELKRIMNSSLDVICSVDEEGKFANVSSASESVWGFKPEELIGRKYMDLVLADDNEITQNAAAGIMSGTPVTMFENRYHRKDGSIVPILWSARWDDDSKLMYCIAKDATEKKRLEKELEDERQQFYNLFLQAPSCIGIFKGPNHIYEFANPLYLQFIGKKDIIGKPVKDVLPELAEQGFIEMLDTVYKTGEPFLANEMLVKLDIANTGSLDNMYLNFLCQPYRNNEGNIKGIFFFIVDVTEQVVSRKKIEESEKRYRQIVETAQEGIWVIDENNLTNFVNPKMAEIIGYRVDEIMGRAIQDFMDEEERKNSYQQIERRKRGISENHDLNFITKDGRLICTNISTNPILDSDGKYKGALAMITDITDYIAWRENLKESEKRYRQIVETAQEGIWIIDKNDKTTFVNNKLCEIFEYSVEEMMGQEIYHFMDEKGKKIAVNLMQQKREGASRQGYFKYISKSGKEIWTNISANPLFNEDGTYKGAMAMITDITKRKQVEESNLFQAELLNNIGQAVMALDLNGIISYWNKAAEKIFGWTAEEAIGDHILNHGPAQQTMEQATEIFTELHKGKSWTGEMEMLRKDGTTFKASLTDSPVFDHDNKLCGVIGIASDITDRKIAEENFQEMQEQLLASQRMAHVGSWHRKIINTGDLKSNPMVYSEEALRILGLPLDTSDMSYEKFLSMVHPDDAEFVNNTSQKIFAEQSSYYKIDHRIVLPNGTIKWVSRDAKVIKDEDTGEPLKIIGTVRDITTAKEQEIELLKNYEERAKMVNDLLLRNKDLEQFTYIVSHNLRAPVANIVGVAGIINDSEINAAERDEMINGLIASVERLDTVVSDLNYILQVKQDHSEIKEKVGFSKLVNDILRSIDHIITKEIKVICDFSEIDEFVTVKSYLYSIFYNLISNSIKYRQPQVPCILTITSYLKNNTIKLTFADNGSGIDLQQRGKEVFGLYKRFHRNIEGKGIGLFMVKTQVEFLGGQISIESAVNKGTTFTIEFIT